MDLIDLKLLELLDENSKSNLSAMGSVVGLSAPAVGERIRKLEKDGIIEKYGIKINRAKMGEELLAFIFIRLDHSDFMDAFRDAMQKTPQILECHHIAGQYDYLLKVLVKNTKELENLIFNVIKTQKGVRESMTNISIATIKEESNLIRRDIV